MPHRLKVLPERAPTVKEVVADMAKAEAREIQKLKQEALTSKSEGVKKKTK